MKIKIRKSDNPACVIIPAAIRRQLKLRTDDSFTKPRYSLKELIAKCEPSEPLPAELALWDQTKAVGGEF